MFVISGELKGAIPLIYRKFQKRKKEVYTNFFMFSIGKFLSPGFLFLLSMKKFKNFNDIILFFMPNNMQYLLRTDFIPFIEDFLNNNFLVKFIGVEIFYIIIDLIRKVFLSI